MIDRSNRQFVTGDLVAIGAGAAFARIGEAPLWLVVVAGAVGMMKFDWLTWWAGRQWGAGIIRMFTASERAQLFAARATQWNPWVLRLAVVLAVLLVSLTLVTLALLVPVLKRWIAKSPQPSRKET